ncbi:MAG: hypothetical protein LBQ54_05975 [Planctomycetaceae bacterium]|jgi:hypothetical protein|nr:hypothetical protein [Planctomycetaceae bacterium]
MRDSSIATRALTSPSLAPIIQTTGRTEAQNVDEKDGKKLPKFLLLFYSHKTIPCHKTTTIQTSRILSDYGRENLHAFSVFSPMCTAAWHAALVASRDGRFVPSLFEAVTFC